MLNSIVTTEWKWRLTVLENAIHAPTHADVISQENGEYVVTNPLFFGGVYSRKTREDKIMGEQLPENM